MRSQWRIVVAFVVTALVVGVGVLREPGEVEEVSPVVPPEIPLAEIDLASVNATRTAFCDQISPEAVEAAVGADVAAEDYLSGERTELEPGLVDVAAEFGCVYTNGAQRARVWVFSSPVSSARAADLARDTAAREGCTRAGVLRFGDPGVTLSCTGGGLRTYRAAGRIGDAWATCELSTPTGRAGADFLTRAQRWCVAAAYAMQVEGNG